MVLPLRSASRLTSEDNMLVWIILGLVALTFVVWVVRTPSFRARRRGHGRDPGESASHGVPTSTSQPPPYGPAFQAARPAALTWSPSLR